MYSVNAVFQIEDFLENNLNKCISTGEKIK